MVEHLILLFWKTFTCTCGMDPFKTNITLYVAIVSLTFHCTFILIMITKASWYIHGWWWWSITLSFRQCRGYLSFYLNKSTLMRIPSKFICEETLLILPVADWSVDTSITPPWLHFPCGLTISSWVVLSLLPWE